MAIAGLESDAEFQQRYLLYNARVLINRYGRRARMQLVPLANECYNLLRIMRTTSRSIPVSDLILLLHMTREVVSRIIQVHKCSIDRWHTLQHILQTFT